MSIEQSNREPNAQSTASPWPTTIVRDVTAGTVVFLVALPLCLGIAVASGAPPFAGILAGVVGGILVGTISGSHTSVSGPAAGLTAIVASQIALLGSFDTFLMAVALAGVIQIALAIAKAGVIASYFPSSVIKGLLAAIGVILIIKQLPYVVGHEAVGEVIVEEMAKESGGHEQRGHENPLATLLDLLSGTYHIGPLIIGLSSLALLISWDRIGFLKRSLVPSPLVVVIFGVVLATWFENSIYKVDVRQLVRIPEAASLQEFVGFLQMPNWSSIWQPSVLVAAITIAIVATLESMLNLEAVDNLDPLQRMSPPNRELLAQGVGNLTAGLIGGLPLTCVVVRGSVNINAGSRTKLSTIFHGCLLLGSAVWFSHLLNRIPLASLAAVLLVTGVKLASPKLIKDLYRQGMVVFLPFVATVVAIVMTDLLIGILIGLGVSLFFILASNSKRPGKVTIVQHPDGPLHHIRLANQVSYLSRSILEKSLRDTPRGGHVLLDAKETDFIDPDILSFIHEFKSKTAPVLGIACSFKGFRPEWRLPDDIKFAESTTSEMQDRLTPGGVLKRLMEGNRRFIENRPLPRDLQQQRVSTAYTPFPTALVMTCMDARIVPELLFDTGLGELMSVRLAGGTFLDDHSLASAEYAASTAGIRLIMVLGQYRSPVIETALMAACEPLSAQPYGEHFQRLVELLSNCIDEPVRQRILGMNREGQLLCAEEVTRQHVLTTTQELVERSQCLYSLLSRGEIGIVGGIYDATTGEVKLISDQNSLPGAMEGARGDALVG